MTTFAEPVDALAPETWSVPFRLGKVFDGWYLDAGCTIPFSGVEEGAEQMELYAGWKELKGVVKAGLLQRWQTKSRKSIFLLILHI